MHFDPLKFLGKMSIRKQLKHAKWSTSSNDL